MVEAARTIERCWCSYRDKQIFKLLKYAICAAVCTWFECIFIEMNEDLLKQLQYNNYY
jgi:hypothetical protein